MTFSPFSAAKETPVAIEAAGQKFWFVSTGYLTPNLKPTDAQVLSDRRRRLSELLFTAQDRYATKHGKKFSEAGQAFQEREAEGALVAAESFVDYLEPTEIAELNDLSSDITLFKDAHGKPPLLLVQVATLLVRHRMAWHVAVREASPAGSRVLRIEPPVFPIEVGDRIKLPGGIKAKVTEPYSPESGELGVEALGAAIEAGADGFLMDGDRLRKGIPDWDEEKTLATVPDVLFEELYAFHQGEGAGGKAQATVPKEPETNSSAQKPTLPKSSSDELSPSSPSTGSKSIGDSKTLAAATAA